MEFFTLEQSVWTWLQAQTKPIVLYGMGDGADKILARFAQFSIPCAGVFASDAFVRENKVFHGMPIQRLSQVRATWGEDFIIVLAFATHRPEVMQTIYQLSEQYPLVAPDVPVVGDTLFDTAFVKREQERLQQAYDLLADERSREVFCDILRFKLSGKLHYLKRAQSTKDEVFTDLLRVHQNEHFADLGAYTGDTIRELLHYTNGQYASVTAIEPDARNFRKLSVYAAQALSPERTRLVQAGAWHENTTLPFEAAAGRQSRLSAQGQATAMCTLDSVLDGQPCTLMKLDVEGAEQHALYGAAHTIARYQPRLNIAAYHRSEDLFALPLTLHRLNPAYRLYLRHHPCIPAWEVNLYAVSR